MDEGTQVVTRKNRILFAGLALVFSCSAFADFPGKVVAVADGDTITVLRDQEQVKVRLTEIDAPEKAQAFGNQAKQALSALVFGKEVRVADHGTDRYRRTLGRVYQGEIDVNAEMIKSGMAWVYRRYSTTRAFTRWKPRRRADARPMG